MTSPEEAFCSAEKNGYFLAPEIWKRIMDELPKYALISCLLVSRVHHSIAQELLFSSVRLLFSGGMDDCNQDMGLVSRTREILQRVVLDADFASIIKEITIFASEPGLCTSEKCTQLF
jgi:hypothetical protein